MDLLLSIIRILDSNEGPKTKQRFETWLEVNLVRGDRRTFQEELRTGEKCLVIKKKRERGYIAEHKIGPVELDSQRSGGSNATSHGCMDHDTAKARGLLHTD